MYPYIRSLYNNSKIPKKQSNMAEFMSGLQSQRPSSYSSFSFLEMDPTLDLHDHSNLSFQINNSIPFCDETNLYFPHELPSQPQNMTGVVPGGAVCGDHGEAETGGCLAGGEACDDGNCYGNKKRKKPMDISQGSCSATANSSDPAKKRKHGLVGKGRKPKGGDEEGGGKKEVVHVRARSGKATDSHSLAERVRREKINERLRCLHDIVPGCYKTMGLAVMLDEIINYVHSLQLQVEFLSMKLTAASSSYDFHSGLDAIEAMQVKAYEAKELEWLLMRSQSEARSTNKTSNLQSTFHHPFDHSL